MLAASGANAGKADVLDAKAQCTADTCTFTATVRHGDTGWDHYANRFEVVGPDGKVLATRVLEHPHVREQPFTRALAGVRIPPGIDRVRVRAGDLVHGLGGAEVEVRIERKRRKLRAASRRRAKTIRRAARSERKPPGAQ